MVQSGDNPIKILIVGSGSAANKHVDSAIKNLNCSITVINESGRHLESPAKVEYIKSWELVASNEYELVVIANPSSGHLDTIKKLIKNNSKFLIEKPLAASFRDAMDIDELMKKHGAKYLVAYQFEFSKSLEFLSNYIKEFLDGKIYYVEAEVGQWLPEWRPNRDYKQTVTARKDLGGGVLLELSHEIHFLFRLFGIPEYVSGFFLNLSELELEVEDFARLNYKVTNGLGKPLLVDITLDCIRRISNRKMRIFHSQGELIWDGLLGTLVNIDKNQNIELLFEGELFSEIRNNLWQMLPDFISGAYDSNDSNMRALKTLEIIDSVKMKNIENNNLINRKTSHERLLD